jgi:hypothetical protein
MAFRNAECCCSEFHVADIYLRTSNRAARARAQRFPSQSTVVGEATSNSTWSAVSVPRNRLANVLGRQEAVGGTDYWKQNLIRLVMRTI